MSGRRASSTRVQGLACRLGGHHAPRSLSNRVARRPSPETVASHAGFLREALLLARLGWLPAQKHGRHSPLVDRIGPTRLASWLRRDSRRASLSLDMGVHLDVSRATVTTVFLREAPPTAAPDVVTLRENAH